LNCTPAIVPLLEAVAVSVLEPETTVPHGFTTTVISSELVSTPSLDVNLRTYVPIVVKVAVELNALALLNVTGPGPLTVLQAFVSGLASVAVPTRFATAGKVIA
jgi:hypothetical protein